VARYVDGFVIAVPKKNVAAYTKIAKRAGKIWLQYGAISYMESVLQDPKAEGMTGFPQAMKAKPNETIFFSWVVYKSRKDRDRVIGKVMSDPKMQMDMKSMPFDVKRMVYGGFEGVVDL
jgi:uncharacterized protein YbaA (DUF1428 family)